MSNKKIMVFLGSNSSEREVSLRSGRAVSEALNRLGYIVSTYDVQHEPLHKILEFQPDLVFLALHGKYGEDGTVQGMLELLGIPYTGSGPAASAICMNKIICKKLLAYENIPTPDFKVFNREEDSDTLQDLTDEILRTFGLPVVIKASKQGSSIGTYIVKEETDIKKSLQEAFTYDEEIFVEKFIKGTEITVSVLGNKDLEVLPIIEITSKNPFYDYDSKYTPGMCEHIIPARIEKSLQETVKQISKHTYKTMGCRGVSRIDFMIDEKGNPYVLEVNTIPGFTQMSLVPDSARAAGMSFDDLVQRIVQLALEK